MVHCSVLPGVTCFPSSKVALWGGSKGVAGALDAWFGQLGRKVKNKALFPISATETARTGDQRQT